MVGKLPYWGLFATIGGGVQGREGAEGRGNGQRSWSCFAGGGIKAARFFLMISARLLRIFESPKPWPTAPSTLEKLCWSHRVWGHTAASQLSRHLHVAPIRWLHPTIFEGFLFFVVFFFFFLLHKVPGKAFQGIFLPTRS